MKILYAIQGTGNGHITRARHLAASFAKNPSAKLDFLFTGRPHNAYFDMQSFGQYQSKRGLSFVAKNGRVQTAKTILKNNVFHFARDVKSTKLSQYDLLINDFEPVSAWAAKLQGMPSLTVSHQAAFMYKVPQQQQSLRDKLIAKYFAPTTYNLGTHWYHFGHNIIPPIVAEEFTEYKQLSFEQKRQQHILVYLPFEQLKIIQDQLNILSDWQFVCYHPNISETRHDRNITWQPPSNVRFKQDLLRSQGVICNSGFELSTECLGAGVPLLIKPLHNQYEQLSNAYTLEKLDLCQVMHRVDKQAIEKWLLTKKGHKVAFPTNCDSLVNWLLQGKWDAPQALCKEMWQQVAFPSPIQAKLDQLQT